MSNCRACDTPISWAKTEHGRTMPVDTIPHPEGTIQLVPMMQSPPKAVVLTGDRLEEARHTHQLHRSHFATCTDPERFRRRGSGA